MNKGFLITDDFLVVFEFASNYHFRLKYQLQFTQAQTVVSVEGVRKQICMSVGQIAYIRSFHCQESPQVQSSHKLKILLKLKSIHMSSRNDYKMQQPTFQYFSYPEILFQLHQGFSVLQCPKRPKGPESETRTQSKALPFIIGPWSRGIVIWTSYIVKCRELIKD